MHVLCLNKLSKCELDEELAGIIIYEGFLYIINSNLTRGWQDKFWFRFKLKVQSQPDVSLLHQQITPQDPEEV